MQTLRIFAGPNGSGKSSVIRITEFDGKEHLLEADAIAKRIDPVSPGRAAIAAGREVLQRARQYLRLRKTFAIETTLSGGWTESTIRVALNAGYYVELWYVCVATPEKSIQRVQERVSRGGHDVPDADIRRRYRRSLSNAQSLIRVVDVAFLFDNSAEAPRLVAKVSKGVLVTVSQELPAWAAELLRAAGL